MRSIYGVSYNEPVVRLLGGVDTVKCRCIAFPNTYHSRVAPLSLADPTKPGHSSVLMFHLVDPTINILSTAHVPPQQLEWYTAKLDQSLSSALDGARVLQKLVESLVDWPMSLDEAERHREALMQEREMFAHNLRQKTLAWRFR
jgi:hypothetical protein